jgi:hypothetical protein
VRCERCDTGFLCAACTDDRHCLGRQPAHYHRAPLVYPSRRQSLMGTV